LLLSSCRDEAAEASARAELEYHALVTEGARPDDARFDAVLADLQKVTPGSKHYPHAQKLLHGIEAGRAQQVRTPLALGPNGRRAPELEAQLAACARLAVLAAADGGVDHSALVALEACRFKSEKLELQFSHPGEYPADGGHHH
jgi:hypothetical protein